MIVMPLMLCPWWSLVKLGTALVCEPSSTLTTILYHAELLPRNLNLDRLVRREFLHRENHFFHFLTTVLRCVW
ncbi:hypothetical protein DEO72_LG8g70 [Vigna unguiculata]|uniref:Secreted protein n=1 Tax=Vigna unguiculata TaxID=3917 RepID=A0A4D6MPL0_VIGUN|nr:hypothetical protein DEO72_LG8g70 [Vigna unguiculata]